MSISSMRWRAASVFITAGAVAGAVLALAVPAGASTGTTEISPEQAGYTATGAQFKTVYASVYPREPSQYASEVSSFGDSIQLWSSSLVIVLGVTTSTRGYDAPYFPYVTIYDRGTHKVIASNPNALWCDDTGDCTSTGGFFYSSYQVTLQISYSPADGHLTMTENSLQGSSYMSSYNVTGQSFTEARIGTDFGSTPWDGSYPHTPPAGSAYVKVAAYSDVTLTSYTGHTATLSSWWANHRLLANTGQQSGSDWVAVPSGLSYGGAYFQTLFVPQNSQGPNQPVLP